MKKFYVLFASLLAFGAAQAQTFTFNYNGTPLEGDSKLVCDDKDAEIDEIGNKFDVAIAPHISVTATMPEDVTDSFNATLTVESLNGQEVQCCAGGECVAGTNITKNVTFVENGGMTVDLQLEYFGYPSSLAELGTLAVKLEIVDEFDKEARQGLTVIMYGDAGVSVIENNKAFYTVKGGFNYDINGSAVVNLYNANGVLCGTYNISGQGFLSAEGMPSGIYFFTVAGEGVNESGKVAI